MFLEAIGIRDDARPGRPVTVTLDAPVTCRCPVNGRRDFGRVAVEYLADDRWVIEYGSFATFLASFTGQAIGHEALTNAVLDAVLGGAAAVERASVTTTWEPIEGVRVTVRACSTSA